MTIRKGPVNLDDQENINRFLEQMMLKNYESAFTSSKRSSTSTTNDNTVRTATTPPELLSPEVDKPQGQAAMSPTPARASSANTPAVTQPDANTSISTTKTMERSRGISLNTGPDDELAPHQLPQWMEENCPPSHRSPTRTAAPHSLVDKFLQSPQMSGLQAPPPTPETGPVSQFKVANIIQSAFDELHNDHLPGFSLGDSKYAPRRKSILGQTRSDLQHSFEHEGYTRFATPNRELSENVHHGRDEAFQRMKSQLNPKQGHFASLTIDADGKGSKEDFQVLSPGNVGPQAHLRPINLSTSVNENNNDASILMNRLSHSAHAVAEDATAIYFSQTAHQLNLSSEQDPGQQISKSQAVKIWQHCTKNSELTMKAAGSLLTLDGSVDPKSTGANWIPPHLRSPTKESLDKKRFKGEVARAVVENLDQAGPYESLKRENGSLVTKFRNISESSLNKDETPPSRLHSKRPSTIFTGENRNRVLNHKAPVSSLANSDGHNSSHSGQSKSGFLAAPSTPIEQATYTPAGSSTGGRTLPYLRPREEFTGVIPHLSRDSPQMKSALPNDSLKHAGPLTSNPFIATAATAGSVIARGTSEVPATVAAVDNSLSALNGLFEPISSAKLPISINTSHPLSAEGNPSSGTNSTPRSAVEMGAITPSSMTFTAVSPATAAAAGITAATREANLEDALFFTFWPKSDDERRPAARIRKVIITNLPPGSTANFVQSLAFGGPIEQIIVASSSASVVFVDADDTKKYYDATANGLVYKNEGGKEHFVLVELAKDVDVVGGLLREMIEKSMTRCVKAIGVEEDWAMPALWKMAERKGRKVEKIVEGVNAAGSRTVTFRFCNMLDAKAFIGVLQRDEEWEHCNMVFAADPCEQATGVHFD